MGANNLLGIPRKSAITRSEVRLFGARGSGVGSSSLVKIFNTVVVNTGDSIVYKKDDVLGDAFQVKDTAMYAICYHDQAGASNAGFSLTVNEDATTLNTTSASLPESVLLDFGFGIISAGGGAAGSVACTYVGLLYAGDVVRAHANSGGGQTQDQRVHFQMCKISGTYGI